MSSGSSPFWIIKFFLAVFAVMTATAAAASPAPGRFDVYFVAVGNSNYAAPSDDTSHGMVGLPGVNGSAEAVASRLSDGGAKYGILLKSAGVALVSADDVLSAILSVETRIKADRPAKPLLIFYFAGHGVSEGVGWNLFPLPGTFLYDGRLPEKRVEDLAAAALSSGQVVDRLKAVGVRYMVVFDTCSEGTERSFESSVLTGPAIDSLRNVASILRFMNEFHQTDPVLFSTAPGTKTSTVPDPLGTTSVDKVAPLARRIIIGVDPVARNNGTLSLGEFVDILTSQTLDPVTIPAVTNATRDADWTGIIASFSSRKGTTETRLGTASEGRLCCKQVPLAVAADKADHAELSGVVELKGQNGEFISGGKAVAFTGTVRVTQDDPSSITLQFGDGNGDWELSFAGPSGGKLGPEKFASAVRYPFAEPGQASMSVNGPGRACNEVRGSFEIRRLDRDASGRISAFQADFRQYCDNVKVPLKGTVHLHGTQR